MSRPVAAMTLLALALLATGLMTGCGAALSPPPDGGRTRRPEPTVVQGTATYRERMALPSSAVFEAVVRDVSIAEASAPEIARVTIAAPSGGTIRFAIPVDPARIDPRRAYAVRARILVDGRPWFSSDAAHPVLTRGAGRTVDIVLRMGGLAAEERRLLGGELAYEGDAARFTDGATGQAHPVVHEGDAPRIRRVYLERVRVTGARLYVTLEGTLADRPRTAGPGVERSLIVSRFINAWPSQRCERLDRRQTYAATVGCNQLAGGYSVDGDRLVFATAAATRMAGPPPLDALERRLAEALGRTRRWQIRGNTLELLDEAGAQVALLEVVHL